MSDLLAAIGLALAVIVPLAAYSFKAALRIQALKAAADGWKASYEQQKARADALERRDDEERQAGLTAQKMVQALIDTGIIAPRKPEVAS